MEAPYTSVRTDPSHMRHPAQRNIERPLVRSNIQLQSAKGTRASLTWTRIISNCRQPPAWRGKQNLSDADLPRLPRIERQRTADQDSILSPKPPCNGQTHRIPA